MSPKANSSVIYNYVEIWNPGEMCLPNMTAEIEIKELTTPQDTTTSKIVTSDKPQMSTLMEGKSTTFTTQSRSHVLLGQMWTLFMMIAMVFQGVW